MTLELHHVASERLMPRALVEDFRDISQQLSVREQDDIDNIMQPTIEMAWQVRRHWNFSAPARLVDREIARAVASGPKERLRLRQAFVAKACLARVGRFSQHLPDSVLSLYPSFYSRIADCLRSDQTYTEDDYSKDVRYALNMTVPAGLLAIDLDSRFGPKLVLRSLRAAGGLRSALSYVRHQSWGTWYNRHLDLRWEPNYTPEGWTDCHLRIAEMLESNEHIRGVQGVSWLYDPALAQVSPHLAYIGQIQTQNGAFLIRIGPGEEHTRRATFKSRTRRSLVEAGEYLPTCYAILWPRETLLVWARKVKRCASFSFVAS